MNCPILPIDSATFAKDVQVDPKEIQSYFDTNKDRYKLPPKITLGAIEYPTAGYLASTPVTKEEALDYYESHKTDYSEPAKFHVRHILIKIAEGADANLLAQKEQLIKKILDEANAGKDFAALAAQYSKMSRPPRRAEIWVCCHVKAFPRV